MFKGKSMKVDFGGNKLDAVASFLVLNDRKKSYIPNQCIYISQSLSLIQKHNYS